MSAARVHADGRRCGAVDEVADVVVVGSGPAGSAVAQVCARAGLEVVVLEEGTAHAPSAHPKSGLRAMAAMYRDLGMSVALGRVIVPYLQGRAMGGTSVVNGGICWRLPDDVWEGWLDADPGLGAAIPLARYREAEDAVVERLGVAPTDPAVAGRKNALLAQGAAALGLDHRPIARNVAGCEGLGRCLQGCPSGRKRSVDRTFLRDATDDGARLYAAVTAQRVELAGGRAVAVRGRTAAGAPAIARARRAVVLAASAIHTPLLLRASGLRAGPTGDGLMAHPGLSVTGRFAEPVHNARGATQGHEVTGLRRAGIKVEALGFDVSILASRVPGVGRAFARRLAELERYAVWGAALRAGARGTVRRVLGHTVVRYALTAEDLALARRSVRILADLLLAAGADEVYPGVPGLPEVVRTPAEAAALEAAPAPALRAAPMSMTHLFGTARMGSDPRAAVVRPDFRHHHVPGLFVADSSVFPSNTGVNPQVAILALARLCGEEVARAA